MNQTTQVFNHRGARQADVVSSSTFPEPQAARSAAYPQPTNAVEYIDEIDPDAEEQIPLRPMARGLSSRRNFNSETITAIWSFAIAFGTPVAAGMFVQTLTAKDYSLVYWLIQLCACLVCAGSKALDERDFKSLAFTSIGAYLFALLSM